MVKGEIRSTCNGFKLLSLPNGKSLALGEPGPELL